MLRDGVAITGDEKPVDSMSGQCAVIVEGVDGQLSLGHVETEMISASLNICSLISDALLISVA